MCRHQYNAPPYSGASTPRKLGSGEFFAMKNTADFYWKRLEEGLGSSRPNEPGIMPGMSFLLLAAAWRLLVLIWEPSAFLQGPGAPPTKSPANASFSPRSVPPRSVTAGHGVVA